MGNIFNKEKTKVTLEKQKKSKFEDKNTIDSKSKPSEKVLISTEILKPGTENKKVKLKLDYDVFVRMFVDPKVELNIGSLAYLIGYKMTYVVDEYRKRIPNVICIVTLKIKEDRNAVYQSEGKKNKKTVYELLKLSKCINTSNYFNRDEQADSLRHKGGNMVAWEHSTKYCAHNVETVAVTFCGKFGDVIDACKKYDNNMAFIESAFTYEEKKHPVLYEVGVTNYSKHERPTVSSGGCLDWFHFFLRPEYAFDYGFWQFQLANGTKKVDKSSLVLSKQFNSMRKVNYSDCEDVNRNRADALLVKDGKKYVANAKIEQLKRDEFIDRQREIEVENVVNELLEELANEAQNELSAKPIIVPVIQEVKNSEPLITPSHESPTVSETINQSTQIELTKSLIEPLVEPSIEPIIEPLVETQIPELDAVDEQDSNMIEMIQIKPTESDVIKSIQDLEVPKTQLESDQSIIDTIKNLEVPNTSLDVKDQSSKIALEQ